MEDTKAVEKEEAKTTEVEEAKAEEVKAEEVKAEGEKDKPEAKTEAKTDEKSPEKTPWFQRRIAELTREKHDAKREVDGLKQQMDFLQKALKDLQEGKTTPTQTNGTAKTAHEFSEAEIQARIDALAQEKAAAARFTEECNKIYKNGTSEFQDFGKSLENFNSLGGLNTPQGANLVAAAMEVDDPHKVIYALANDLDEASRIMALPPVRQAAALVKYATSLTAKPAKTKSSAPDPIKPINGNAKAAENLDSEDIAMDDWIALREKQLAAKRKRA